MLEAAAIVLVFKRAEAVGAVGSFGLVLFSLALRHSVRRGTLNQY